MKTSSKVLTSENILIINHNTLTFHHHNLLMELKKNIKYPELIKDKRLLDYDDMQLLGYLINENSSKNLLNIFTYPSTFDDYKKVLRTFYSKMNQSVTDIYIVVNEIFSSKFIKGYILKEKEDKPLTRLDDNFEIIECDDMFSYDEIMKIISNKKITALVADDIELILKIAQNTTNMSFMYPKFAYNMEYNKKYKTDMIKFSDKFDELEINNKHEYIEYESFHTIDKKLFSVG